MSGNDEELYEDDYNDEEEEGEDTGYYEEEEEEHQGQEPSVSQTMLKLKKQPSLSKFEKRESTGSLGERKLSGLPAQSGRKSLESTNAGEKSSKISVDLGKRKLSTASDGSNEESSSKVGEKSSKLSVDLDKRKPSTSSNRSNVESPYKAGEKSAKLSVDLDKRKPSTASDGSNEESPSKVGEKSSKISVDVGKRTPSIASERSNGQSSLKAGEKSSKISVNSDTRKLSIASYQSSAKSPTTVFRASVSSDKRKTSTASRQGDLATEDFLGEDGEDAEEELEEFREADDNGSERRKLSIQDERKQASPPKKQQLRLSIDSGNGQSLLEQTSEEPTARRSPQEPPELKLSQARSQSNAYQEGGSINQGPRSSAPSSRRSILSRRSTIASPSRHEIVDDMLWNISGILIALIQLYGFVLILKDIKTFLQNHVIFKS